MNVAFVHNQSGEELLTMQCTDVAGLLAAAKGESITFPRGRFVYDYHTLDHYVEDGAIYQELVIYMEVLDFVREMTEV